MPMAEGADHSNKHKETNITLTLKPLGTQIWEGKMLQCERIAFLLK